MSTIKIITEVSKPEFYSRVGFFALKAAQNVATESDQQPNHKARVEYANRVFRGEDGALLLAMHVVASNGTISQTIINGSGDDVPDGDLEFAIASIWDARANAFAPPAAGE